ncbi:MAG TPA: helix-turn-helix transcriptional regulator [Pseudoduganella sp.]
MAPTSIRKFQSNPDPVKMELGWANIELFPSAPYSVSDASHLCILGLAFERQRGVDAIASDRRRDFDAWPGDLALTSPDVNIFSESAIGGEYLAVRIATQDSSSAPPRTVFRGDRRAVDLGARLRRLLLAAQPDAGLIEEQLALFLERGFALLKQAPQFPSSYELDRHAHSRVLEFIDDAIDGPLDLDQLAQLAGMSPLRFLRSFSNAVGATPHAYITERRLQRARALLRSTKEPIASIALDCGFSHQSHLGAVFKEKLGVSPHQYRVLCGGAP